MGALLTRDGNARLCGALTQAPSQRSLNDSLRQATGGVANQLARGIEFRLAFSPLMAERLPAES